MVRISTIKGILIINVLKHIPLFKDAREKVVSFL